MSTSSPSSSTSHPPVDKRGYATLLKELTDLVPYYMYNEWKINSVPTSKPFDYIPILRKDDVGLALLQISSHLMETIIARLNKVPEKNFIEFLNVLGSKLLPSSAANGPVIFTLADGAKDDVFIPKTTKLAAGGNENHGPLTFETEEDLLVTRSKLVHFYTVVKEADAIFSHSEQLLNGGSSESFQQQTSGNTVQNIQSHIFYIGHPTLLNLQRKAIVFITISSNGSTQDEQALVETLVKECKWEYNWPVDPKSLEPLVCDSNTIEIDRSYMSIDPADHKTIKIIFDGDDNPINKQKLMDVDNYWIRCRLPPMNSHNAFSYKKWLNLPNIKDISIKVYPFENLNNDGKPPDPEKTFVNADELYYNDIPIYTETVFKGAEKDYRIYPFGKIPTTLDSFYISSNDAFSKKGNQIILSITEPASSSLLDGQNESLPILSWEYWNGLAWNNLKVRSSRPQPLQSRKSRTVSRSVVTSVSNNFTFLCPEDIQKLSINGANNYWIRIRIASGDYGNGKLVKDPATSGDDPIVWIWNYDDINFPKISKLRIRVEYLNNDTNNEENKNVKKHHILRPSHCVSFNNLELSNHITSSGEFIPFRPFVGLEKICDMEDNEFNTWLFMGFDKKITKGPIHLLFSIDENSQPYNGEDQTHQPLQFLYKSFDAEKKLHQNKWCKLDAFDETTSLSRTGYVVFYFPDDFDKVEIFGKNIFWVKTKLNSKLKLINKNNSDLLASEKDVQYYWNNEYTLLPKINGIYLNTASALHCTTISGEILGSSDGSPNQVFKFANSMTLSRNKVERIWVNEGRTDDFEEDHLKENLKDNKVHNNKLFSTNDKQKTQIIKSGDGKIIETWITWKEVEDFDNSAPEDRHYIIDRATGVIEFGNGVRGKIPPILQDNMKTDYVSGGGKEGNVLKSEIDSLKSMLPFIEKVTNLEFDLGFDKETTEKAMGRIPHEIRHRGQAVSAEDYERIILDRFPSIARVKCLAASNNEGITEPGKITIIIVPLSYEVKPTSSQKLIYDVEKVLECCCSNTVICARNLKVISPLYVGISIIAELYPISISDSIMAEREADLRLKKYLHPLTGGDFGNGWDFGQVPCVSDIYSLLNSIPEIDHVENVNIVINAPNNKENLTGAKAITSFFMPRALVYSERHVLTIKVK